MGCVVFAKVDLALLVFEVGRERFGRVFVVKKGNLVVIPEMLRGLSQAVVRNESKGGDSMFG